MHQFILSAIIYIYILWLPIVEAMTDNVLFVATMINK